MGKKRVNPESTRRRVEVGPSKESEPSVSGHRNGGNNRRLFYIFAVVSASLSVFIYRHLNHSPVSPYVHQRRLVKADVNYQEILAENFRVPENATRRHFPNRVLVYVTPWNSAGYDLAKRFNSKFTHISPVWYELKSVGTKLVLEGRHNADIGWLSELRLRGSAKVLPRVVLEVLPQDLLGRSKWRDKAIDLIVTECKGMDYDGVVLESWSTWAAYGVVHDAAMRKTIWGDLLCFYDHELVFFLSNKKYSFVLKTIYLHTKSRHGFICTLSKEALQFVKQLGEILHNTSSLRSSEHLQLVYVIGPPHSEKLQAHDFGPEDLWVLSESVDGFSLMTYDYSNPYRPGPNAPLKWLHSALELLLGKSGKSLANKIFVGINFYGNDFTMVEGASSRAITGRDYLALLDQHKPKIEWQKNFAEHFFLYSDDKRLQNAVFYPSLMSISQRLEEAYSWGAGISIWEIGQGLDYFFDLL